MTLLGRLLSPSNASSVENPEYLLTSTALLDFLGVQKTHAGTNVTEESALGMSAVWRAVSVTSNVPAALPFRVYMDAETGGRVAAKGPMADLVADPHPDSTAFELWQTVFMHKRLWGNAYLRILRDGLRRPVELWPIHPARVRVGREAKTARKVYAIDGEEFVLGDFDILHLPGIGYDGITGVSPVRVARQSIGLGMAAEEFGARLFGSGSLASGILQTEQRLTQEQATQLAERWKDKAGGLGNAGRTVVLDKGAKFEKLTINPDDAQFLDTRRFQITEVARWFGVPPFLMFETEKSTSWGTGLEQQAIGWVKIDLLPELIAIEQRITKHLIGYKGTYAGQYAHYSVEGLLRGDSAARATFYKSLWSMGALSTNEIRAYEEMPPVEGGDVRYRPLNMGELGTTDSAANPAAIGDETL